MTPPAERPSAPDEAAIAAQLGRRPRGLHAVANRCPCGLPAVIETAPRLDDGTPFPTLYYLTCPKAVAAVSRLEADGVMREMTERLGRDTRLSDGYSAAHRDYLDRRERAAREAGVRPLPPGTQSAGGMPERVKCLHALVAHELAAPGVNPFGADALRSIGAWWADGPCVPTATGERPATGILAATGERPDTGILAATGEPGESRNPASTGEEARWRG